MSRYQDYLQDLRTLPTDAMLAYRHEGANGALLSRTYAWFTPHLIPAGIN